ncbi:MAG: tRNA (N6-isopentenyl adenosine(37)-C2)-methylthiotransferase MiaB [Desulfovibrionales bacterium]
MKFSIKTFGCQMNACDSEWLARSLTAKGWEEGGEDSADFVLINTCSVREKPELKVYSQIGRYREVWEKNPDFFVGVGGCVAQQVGKELWKRFPYVRLVFGTDGLSMVPQALDRLVREKNIRTSLLDFLDYYPERDSAYSEKMGPSAFVTIMQGCDNFCAYCIVPHVRGRQKSRRSEDVLQECRNLIARGVKEVTLLGQNVNSYGLDRNGDGTSFASLLESVAALPGLERIRFTTSHPKDIAPEVVAAFGTLEKLCPQLHLPIQSGSDRILARMGRKYTREEYMSLVDKLRKVCPDISLSTDFIVGFPGETDEDFAQTLEVLNAVGFEGSFSFKYCDRPGVRSEIMDGKVDETVKAARLKTLQDLQTILADEALARRVGAHTEVLVEGESKRDTAEGRSWKGRDPGGRIVNFSSMNPEDLTGRFIKVRITAAKKHSLAGRMVHDD